MCEAPTFVAFQIHSFSAQPKLRKMMFQKSTLLQTSFSNSLYIFSPYTFID